MPDEVKVAAASLRLGLLTVWIFQSLWPDWQLTFLFTRGSRAAGMVEPSNGYPGTGEEPNISVEETRDLVEADRWSCSVQADTKATELDDCISDTTKEQ